MHTVLDKDAHGATDSITLSKSDTNAQTASELNTQSASELNFEGARELNTQSASEPNSQSASEPNKQSLSDTHTQNEGDTSVSKASDSDTRSASELNTQSAIEPDTQSASEPDIQTAGGPNTQSLSDTQTQIEGDITIDSSTDIHTYDEHDEINLHQEVVSDSEPNPQVNFEEEYILVLEPVPHSEMETKPQEIDTVLSKLDVQTTETDIHDGNTLLHEVPQIEPEPDTHQQVDAKSQMLTNTGINTDSVEMEDLEPDNSPRINHEGQLTNIETDSESITKAGSSVNAQLNEIHSNTNAETSSQTTGDSVMESEQGQTSDDPENIHDITGISEHNMYSAKNSQTNSVSQNETSIGEQSDLQSKNEQPTLSESFIHHHVSTEGAQLEANAIRAQTDLPTETGTASDAHEYKTTLEMDSTEPDKENRNVHFKESSEYETASNIPDEDQSDNTKNVELVEETLPIQSQLVSVAENDDQERVSQSRDDPGDDLPLDDISLDEQSGLNLSDDEKNEHDVEYHVKRDESAPGEKNESEAPLSDEMKALMNHKIVPRKRRRHDITDEDDEENFLSGVFSAREHHIIHLERSKQEEEESEETKKRKEKTHRKGEKIDHEGSGMERAEAIQPLGLDNYSPRKIEIDMQLMERQLVTDSIPAEEKERVRLRKLRKTKINIEYDLRHHRDEMRGEYLDDEDEEELEEEEDDKKLEPDRNEYGRTIMSKDMSPIMQYGWESGMSPIIESGWESDMNPIMEYGWGGDLINVGDRKTSSQGDEISSKPHMRGGSSLDQNTVEPDFVGLPPGIVIDENTSLTEETHREDVGSEGEEIENEDEEMAGSDQEQTTHHNPAAADNDQRIVHRVGETEPQNNEHKRLQAETEETDEQTNAQDGHSQERGASKNRELAQDEADPDIQVIDGTTLHLSDLLPTPLSDEIHTQILPTPTQEADPTNILEANLNSQEMDLNPTRSTGRETPDREQDEKWIVKDHQQIEDQHTKFLREAENFMKTRSTENMSPQMGRVVKDLMRKGIMDSGPKEEAPNQDLKPSTETQDGPQKSDGDDLKDTGATDDSEIVLPSGQDLDSEKVNNFFNQLMTLPQFLNQPHKALRELHKYIENPSTRVGLTKNEYQFKRQQKEEEKPQKSHEEDKMGAEQTSEDQDHHEPELKTPMEELEESDPEKLLRDEHQSQDDLAAGEAYLQAQEEEMRREKESQMKKGDEGDANQGVMQDERRDTYASSAENIQEDAKLFVDPARLLRESEQQDDQNVVQVEDGQQKINEEGENSQDMLKGSQENGDRTEVNLPEDEAPVDSIPGGIADRIENILLSNLNGEPSLEQITEQATTVEDEQLNINRYEDGQNSQDMLKDNQENGDGTDGLPEDTAPADSIPGVIADQMDTILQSNSNGEPNLEEVIDQGTTAPSLDDVESGVGSPSESEPSGSQDVNLEQNDTPESQYVHLEPTDAPESLQEGVNHKEVYVEVTYPNENELGKEASHQDPLLNNQGHQEMIVLTDEEVQHVDLSPVENSRSAEMHQGHEEMNVLTDAEAPHNDLTSSEHSRSAETHQEIEELFASLDSVDVPNQNHHHESILDAHKMTEESIEEPPKLSRPPTTEDPYLEEMHKMESTVHAPVEEQEMFENMYNTKETDEAPSDAGTVLEHSETQTEVKDDATSNPHLEEIVATTPTPPVASHVHLHVADTKDQHEGNNPSDTGRIFEGGNSDIHSDVEVEVEVEEEVGGDIPGRFNRRQVPLGLDEGNAFSDPGLSTMNDTYDEDHWTMTGINMMKPVLVAINISLQPLMQLLPDDVQLALHGADFLGIPWPILIVIELISCAVFSFLLCLCLCSCRNPKAFNSAMLDEIEALHGQKADILDTLDMTTVQFKTQNRHYYELKQNADKNQKERSKLSQSCKDLKNKIQTLEKELSLIKSTSGQNEKQLSASQQQVDLYEEQVSTASQTITALQQQVYDLERNLHECATTIGMLKQEKQSLSEQNQLLTSTKEQQSEEIEGWNERVSEMNEQVELLHDEKKDLEESVTYKDNEIEVLKDCLLQLKGLDADDDELENDKEGKVQQLMDVTRVSAKLSLVEGEKTELEAKYEAEVKGRRELEAKVGAQQQEVDTAKANYKKAKSSLDEALTKLDVMTEYFKNKEVDLQRKLGREEALRLHSDSKLENADEKAATAEVEVTNYRTQIKDLKEELVKAERNYRNQVAAHEKKAHDSWMSVRNAERELQEAKREAANLRHRLTELEGRRAKTEAAPLFKPSPSGRAPSRNSLLADTPSPPRLDQSRALSPGRPIYPGDHPPSPPVDNDYRRSSRSGRDSGPPSFPDDGPPPPHMRRDMDYPPMGRLPPPGRHSRGPPMHDMDDYPHDMRDYSPDGPPPDFGFDPHGPPPPDMDFGPHGPPPFNGPPPPLRHPFPPRDFPPHPDDFDHRGPVPDDRDFGPPMGDHEFGPPRGYGPPPPGMDFGPMGPPPPGGPMHGPGPFPNDMGPPPMDRREPPPPIGRPGPAPGPQNPGIRPNSRGPFPPQTGPSPSGRFPPSGPPFGTPTGPQRRTSTPLEGTPSTPQTRPGSRPAQGP
ncbi:transport and Golgi organization protein 1 homolog isoform X3 [Asterias rubens]|uniref:transport and Golgi organization protein 1 homolog isoform X3 n=1 Tax=Asterias rubens TaxID=7604 RepID=UPI0014559AF1|nr:transport and Golgi organization protein 1 homolog isoform X3 [Asterias rubens]